MDGVSLIARAGIYVGKMYGRGKEEGKKKKEKKEKTGEKPRNLRSSFKRG